MFTRCILLMAAVCCLNACDRATPSLPPAPVVVKTVTVESSQSAQSRIFPARIIASDMTDLAFKRGGLLQSVPLREGTRVQKGAVIARLNDAEARLLLQKKQSASDVAQRQFVRYADLARRHLVSQADLDLHRQQRDTAQAALKLAREEISDLTLLAPFDGVISKVHLRHHHVIAAGQPVVTLNRTDSLDVIFSIPERLFKAMNQHNAHLPFQVQLSALPGKSFTAHYKEHATNSDHGTLTWQITLTLPRPAEWPDAGGLSGTVTLPADDLAGAEPAVRVPVSALFSTGKLAEGKSHVWVIKQNNEGYFVEDRPVTPGKLSAAGVEITAGLTAGEKIVAAGVQSLRPHQTVRLWERERGL